MLGHEVRKAWKHWMRLIDIDRSRHACTAATTLARHRYIVLVHMTALEVQLKYMALRVLKRLGELVDGRY